MKKLLKTLRWVLVIVALCIIANIAATTFAPVTNGQDKSMNNSDEQTSGIPRVDYGQTSSTLSVYEDVFSLGMISAYDGEHPYIEINGNVPFFDEDEITTTSFEEYSDLDDLGRCGCAYANICQELMPTEKRGDISQVKPSGWGHNNRYDFVDGQYIWNRCHLIGFQLAGENANEKNLITGTRYLNIDGMLSFENEVADYVEQTGNHVLYRVTPVYVEDHPIADGVLMEGYSVEDDGKGVCFNVYAYNVQPGVEIDYRTGENWASSTYSNQDGDTYTVTNEGGLWS